MKKSSVRNLAISGLLVAIGLILPFFTGKVPNIGRALLPMHIPALIAGFVVGPGWAGIVGAVLPLLNHLLTGMPPLETAIPMVFELAAYGILAGVLYKALPKKTSSIYLSLVGAMLGGRIVWGVAKFIYMRLLGASFTWELFAAGAFLGAVPGIILQVIIIPPIVYALQRANLIEER